MRIAAFLFANGAFPFRSAAAGLIIMAGEKPCFVGKGENVLNGRPEFSGAAARKISARSAGIGHEKRIVHKGGISYHIGHGGQRMPG
ncbi:hypothetical protein D3C78_1632160 [compost metagenome]